MWDNSFWSWTVTIITVVVVVFPILFMNVNDSGDNGHGQNQRGLNEYLETYKKSIDDNKEFWSLQAKRLLDWQREFTVIHSGSLDKGNVKWFEDGLINAAYNCVDRHAETRPHDIALIWEGDAVGMNRFVNYKELSENVNRFANWLKSKNVEKGNVITIYMPVLPETIIAMLGCAKIGAVHNVVFAGFSVEALADRIIDSNSKILITVNQGVRGGKTIPLKQTVDEALQRATDIKTVLVYERTSEEVPMVPERDELWSNVIPLQSTKCDPVFVEAEHPLFMLYTSGSTGKPKGLVHTTGGYLSYVSFTIEQVFALKIGDIFASTADVGWITGHSYTVYGTLSLGVTTVLFDTIPTFPNPSRCWEMIQRLRVSHFYTAPTVIRDLRRHGEAPLDGFDRSTLKVLGSVGEPINADAWKWYSDKVGQGKCPIVDTYWQTETGGHVITPLAYKTITKPGSATLPFYGIKPVILNPVTGKEIEEPNIEGILVFKNSWPGIARTILGDHEKYLNTYLRPYPGYFSTGDMALCDLDGYYWIRGRIDDVINVSGHRLGTAEIESVINKHDACSESAVLGRPDPITGQSICAFCILKNDNTFDRQTITKEIISLVRHHIGGIAAPKHIIFCNGLPKTRSGKIMRRILRKILEGELDQDKLGDLSTLSDPSIISHLIALVKVL